MAFRFGLLPPWRPNRLPKNKFFCGEYREDDDRIALVLPSDALKAAVNLLVKTVSQLSAYRTKDTSYELAANMSGGSDQKNEGNLSHEIAVLILRAFRICLFQRALG